MPNCRLAVIDTSEALKRQTNVNLFPSNNHLNVSLCMRRDKWSSSSTASWSCPAARWWFLISQFEAAKRAVLLFCSFLPAQNERSPSIQTQENTLQASRKRISRLSSGSTSSTEAKGTAVDLETMSNEDKICFGVVWKAFRSPCSPVALASCRFVTLVERCQRGSTFLSALLYLSALCLWFMRGALLATTTQKSSWLLETRNEKLVKFSAKFALPNWLRYRYIYYFLGPLASCFCCVVFAVSLMLLCCYLVFI